MSTARLEGEDGLYAWYKYEMLLYRQVVNVAGDGQWCGRIGGKNWMIDVPVEQYFGLTGGVEVALKCWC